MTPLATLADRVEAYDPRQSLDNRADEMPLDLAIAKAVGVAGDDWQVARGSVTGYFSGDGVGGFGNPTVPLYTRSLDAAWTLVPDGHLAMVTNCGAGDPKQPDFAMSTAVVGLPFDEASEPAEAATAPLALCVAALRALARASASA